MKRGITVNPEFKTILFVTFVLMVIGVLIFIYRDSYEFQKFNFHSSEIIADGNLIKEKLEYKPDKDYHTLYRSFTSNIHWNSSENNYPENSVVFNSIICSSGTSYLRETGGKCYNSGGSLSCPAYTEDNEYGCTYGNNFGFKENQEYSIESEYFLNPSNLFSIDGKYYIKFVAYSGYNHIKLTEKNFLIGGNAVAERKYLPDENVIIYIPYTGNLSGFNIIESEDFEFDSRSSIVTVFMILFSVFPGIFIFLMWYFYGREKSYEEMPKELSTFPNKRKFWEVSVYFNSPLLSTGKNFFSSIMLNFYNKKIIDIKEKEGEIYIKLNEFNGDETEKKVYSILTEIKNNLKNYSEKDIFYGEYFNFKKAMTGYPSLKVYKKFTDIQEKINEGGKEYIKNNASRIILFSFLFLGFGLFMPVFFFYFEIVFLYVFSLIMLLVFAISRDSLYMRFEKDYYIEYQKWKAFKRYLKNSFSIRTATHKTLVIWNEYLIYATALGVPERVIKELKYNHIISGERSNFYTGIATGSYFGFNSFGTGGTSGGGFSGGGFGGAGGGGIGGGGGGGR